MSVLLSVVFRDHFFNSQALPRLEAASCPGALLSERLLLLQAGRGVCFGAFAGEHFQAMNQGAMRLLQDTFMAKCRTMMIWDGVCLPAAPALRPLLAPHCRLLPFELAPDLFSLQAGTASSSESALTLWTESASTNVCSRQIAGCMQGQLEGDWTSFHPISEKARPSSNPICQMHAEAAAQGS